jgi:hypothetical protein
MWHYNNTYNDFTYDNDTYINFTYDDNTSSPAIQLASFLLAFLLLNVNLFIGKISYN